MMNTKLLKLLERNQDCYIYFDTPLTFIIYKEKPKFPLSEDYMNVITLYEGHLDNKVGLAPDLVWALATMMGIDVESKKEEEEFYVS